MTEEILIENLHLDPKDHPIIFSEPSLHNKENRIKLTEIMLEKYNLPAMFICKSAVLSSFSCGRSTCLIFDSGHSTTYAVPVHDGYALQKALLKVDIAGNYITNELLKIVEHNKNTPVVPHYKFNKVKVDEQFMTEYYNPTTIKDDPSYEAFWKREIVRDAKESCLSVNEDAINLNMFNSNLNQNFNFSSQQYELPDGKVVDLSEERVTLLERLFNPIREFPGFNGYHQMISDSINKGDLDIKKEMFSNIFVCGGNSLFPNLPERIQKQLYNTTSQSIKVKVITHPSPAERKFSSWIGGSILSSLGTFHQLWLSKQEYDEHGALIIERKCA